MPYIFIVVLCAIQGFLFLLHFLIYKTFLSIFPLTSSGAAFHLKIILIVMSLSFVISSFLASRYYNPVSRIIYAISSVWLGLVLYLTLAAIIYWLVFWVSPFLGLSINTVLFGKILILIVGMIGVYSLIHAHLIEIKFLQINLPNLPAAWEGKRAVWISDLHLGQLHSYTFAAGVVKMVHDLHPDIIFIGGDLYDSTTVDIDEVTKPFATLTPPMGTYFITGNHEDFFDNTKYLNAVRNAGIRILNDEEVDLNGVTIIGLDYRSASDSKNYENMLKELTLNKSKPIILLKHDPLHYEIAEKYGIDLELGGHTHQMQLFPLGIITSLLYRGFDYGLHQLGSMQIYTSSGVGTWGPPMRFLTDPEIVMIEFHNK